ncbi:MAG: EscU/YscU/HrcU family type III secretion system export apparatus switch protein [Leptospiraceae bacterium]|nr:EscU/YscU/HrcU family type III secretion system export apparatus switch protein [Leptospiraceae bacterium]
MKSVALKFLPDSDKAPRVIASGDGYLGYLIYKLGKSKNVPIEKNPELAEFLSQVPVGEEIPENLYLAVAKIFAFLDNLEKDLIHEDT